VNLRSVFNFVGWALLILAVAMLLNALAGVIFQEYAAAWVFAQSAVLIGFLGGGFVLSTRGEGSAFDRQESYVFLVVIWPLLGLASALPLYLSAPIIGGYGSIFEAISGITTTGATVFTSPEDLLQTILLWRAMTQWLGGFLTIVLVVVVLTHLNIGGLEIFQNVIPSGEGGQLSERLLRTARDIIPVYGVMTIACLFALMLSGMPGFDALCHAMSTISTGGFSTHSQGIVAFPGVWIELSLMLFMIVGSVNFTLHWGLLHGRWWVYKRNREFKYLLMTIAAGIVVVPLFAGAVGELAFWTSFHHSVFAVISMITTTGYFSTANISSLGVPVILLAVLAIVGASTGSTAGGLKLLRFVILLKQAIRELHRLAHPHGVVSIKFGRQRLSENAIGSVWAYFFVLILVLAASTLLVTLSGVEIETAMAASMAALANTGPVLTVVDAGGYSSLPPETQILLCVVMILGRIELLAFFTLFNPSYWKN
jgi:trk system potassium uptake protein TrkH